jgi:hypothetical protein
MTRRLASGSLSFFAALFLAVLTPIRPTDGVERTPASLSFAAFTDTHVGQSIRSPKWGYADCLDRLAQDVMDNALPCEFVVHLGDASYDNAAFINGAGLPERWNQVKNNFNAFFLSHLNLP